VDGAHQGAQYGGMQTCDVLLRQCLASDLSALEAWAPTGNSRTHAWRFSRQQAGTSTYYLASCQQAPENFVGSCEVRWDGCAAPEVPRCPEINGLQVWPEHLQSRGIGTQMLALVELEVRARGLDTLGLGVDDARAKALYLRLGYRYSGLDYVDRYSWVDRDHREHQVAEWGQWMTKTLTRTGAVAS
jgi:ribosomal protein S18 acetylase RimI-like enzyme